MSSPVISNRIQCPGDHQLKIFQNVAIALGAVALAAALIAACVFGGAHISSMLGYGSLISEKGLEICIIAAKWSAIAGGGAVGFGFSLRAVRKMIELCQPKYRAITN